MASTRIIALPVVASALTISGCWSEATIDDGHTHHHNAVSVDATISGYDWEAYATYVPYGTARLAVDLHHLSQDADLYVESPDGSHACESLHAGSHPDACVLDYPMPGEWYVEVFGWEYDPMDYTLSVTLWPSDLEASLWLLGDHAAALTTNTLSLDANTERATAAQRFLPLLRVAADRARTLATGESAFGVITTDGRDLGKAILVVTDEDQQRRVRVKAVMADPQTGDRYVIQTDTRRPLIIDEHPGAPQDGIVSIRRKGDSTTVRLGTATGTGADIQLVTWPGPVTRELRWAGIGGEAVSLESQ
jgi:hypothetical protein